MNSDEDTAEQVRGGLPHSETPGSPIARISPGLFAACCVLHRLSVPRHPPDALLFARSQDAARQARLAATPPTRHPGTRRAQGQAPAAPPNGVLPNSEYYPTTRAPHRPPPARRSMKTLLRTASPPPPPLTPQTHGLGHKIGRGRRQPPSASVTFTNSFHPVNQHRPATGTRRRRPGTNPVFSECRLQRSAIRCQRSDLSSDLDRLSSDQVPD